jgi:hypothetical protein
MNKDELVKFHADLSKFEQICGMNGIRGHDMKSVLESIWEVQQVVEKMVDGLSTPDAGQSGGSLG